MIVNGYMGNSFILDCTTSDPNVNVTFWKLNHRHRQEELKADGKKYFKISKQQMEIKDLSVDEGTRFSCKAPGLSDKNVDVFIQPGE